MKGSIFFIILSLFILLTSGCGSKISKGYVEDLSKKLTAALTGEIIGVGGEIVPPPIEKKIEVMKTTKIDDTWCVDVKHVYRYADRTKQGSLNFRFTLKEPVTFEEVTSPTVVVEPVTSLSDSSKQNRNMSGVISEIPGKGTVKITGHPNEFVTEC